MKLLTKVMKVVINARSFCLKAQDSPAPPKGILLGVVRKDQVGV